MAAAALNVPAPHAVHAEAPSPDRLPASQSAHAPERLLDHLPARQSWQLTEEALLYVPPSLVWWGVVETGPCIRSWSNEVLAAYALPAAVPIRMGSTDLGNGFHLPPGAGGRPRLDRRVVARATLEACVDLRRRSVAARRAVLAAALVEDERAWCVPDGEGKGAWRRGAGDQRRDGGRCAKGWNIRGRCHPVYRGLYLRHRNRTPCAWRSKTSPGRTRSTWSSQPLG